MKKIVFAGILSVSFLSVVTLAQQSGEEKKSPSMQGMMKEIMKQQPGSAETSKGTEGMMGMTGMMMKMMEQCGAMMESSHHPANEAKETPN